MENNKPDIEQLRDDAFKIYPEKIIRSFNGSFTIPHDKNEGDRNRWLEGAVYARKQSLQEIEAHKRAVATQVEMSDRLLKEIEQLKRWKESAMEVMNDINLQEIRKILNVKLGEDIPVKILPAIKSLKAEIEQLKFDKKQVAGDAIDWTLSNINSAWEFERQNKAKLRYLNNLP